MIGHKAGDLVFIVETLPHPDFTRRNDDLHMDMDISLLDALASEDEKSLGTALGELCWSMFSLLGAKRLSLQHISRSQAAP